jgi:hypothetical protein
MLALRWIFGIAESVLAVTMFYFGVIGLGGASPDQRLVCILCAASLAFSVWYFSIRSPTKFHTPSNSSSSVN